MNARAPRAIPTLAPVESLEVEWETEGLADVEDVEDAVVIWVVVVREVPVMLGETVVAMPFELAVDVVPAILSKGVGEVFMIVIPDVKGTADASGCCSLSPPTPKLNALL